MVELPGVAVRIPPQEVDAFASVAITIPPGMGSEKLKSLAAPPSFSVLSISKFSVLVPPGGIELGSKLLIRPGRPASTFRVASAVPPLPALDVRSPETFWCCPSDEQVTWTLTVQEPLAEISPSSRLIVVPPAGALRIALVQVLKALDGFAIVTPAGKTSVKARLSTGSEVQLTRVNWSRLVLPGPISLGVKDFEKETASWAFAAPSDNRNIQAIVMTNTGLTILVVECLFILSPRFQTLWTFDSGNRCRLHADLPTDKLP
jgi:hypothetical protein